MSLSGVEKRFLEAAIIINALCLGLFLFRYLLTGSWNYGFIPLNLLLAWLAFVFGWWLNRYLNDNRWLSWQAVGLTLLWLVFLPNTWYVMTDFIHLRETGEISLLYDTALVDMLVAAGFLAGFGSLVLFHKQLLRRISHAKAALAVAVVILISSFAIYLGRDLRWNSWDAVANPGGVVLNTADRLSDPFGHPRMLNFTTLFFVVIGGTYLAVWQFVKPKN